LAGLLLTDVSLCTHGAAQHFTSSSGVAMFALLFVSSLSIPTNKGRKVSPHKFRPFLNYPYVSVQITYVATG
jgi:hypothetical protein